MGMSDFFNKINMAGGKNTAQAFYKGLEDLGLKVVHQEGANSKLEGKFKGYDAAMSVDGSRMMKAANKSMAQGYGTALAGMTGLIPSEHREWEENWAEFKARDRMQTAEMLLKWAVFTKEKSPDEGSVSHDKKLGEEIGKKLYTNASGKLKDVFKDEEIIKMLKEAPFDEIAVKEKKIRAFWSPTMSEYGKAARSADEFAKTAKKVLKVLTKIASKMGI